MKKILFFVFVLFVSINSFAQDLYVPLDDTPIKVSNKTILAVIEKAKIENKIKDIDVIPKGQTILFRYPDGGSFRHTFRRGDNMFSVVKNYLTIPNYEQIVAPRKRTYHPSYIK